MTNAIFEALDAKPRQALAHLPSPLERMANLEALGGGARLYVKRDDCTGLAMGGNKLRQLEYYFGEAKQQNADTVLITGAVQSNFVRLAAASANRLGMHCHIQLEQRVAKNDPLYANSGNVLLDRMLGATIHSYPHGEDEAGADAQLESIADDLPPINPEITADPVTLEVWVDLDFTRDNTFFEEMVEDFVHIQVEDRIVHIPLREIQKARLINYTGEHPCLSQT